MTIHVHDILDFLVAKSSAPSTMGAQLDRLRYGTQIEPDPHRQKEEIENRMLQQASIIRCFDAFREKERFSFPGQTFGCTSLYKTLEKIQKVSRRGQGALAEGILRAYHERVTCYRGSSQERGLVEVYNYISTIAPTAVPKPPKAEKDLLQAFRENTAKRAKSVAAEAYADSLLALNQHVRVWNKKGG